MSLVLAHFNYNVAIHVTTSFSKHCDKISDKVVKTLKSENNGISVGQMFNKNTPIDYISYYVTVKLDPFMHPIYN